MGYYYILWLAWLSRFKIPGGSEALEQWLSSIRIFKGIEFKNSHNGKNKIHITAHILCNDIQCIEYVYKNA